MCCFYEICITKSNILYTFFSKLRQMFFLPSDNPTYSSLVEILQSDIKSKESKIIAHCSCQKYPTLEGINFLCSCHMFFYFFFSNKELIQFSFRSLRTMVILIKINNESQLDIRQHMQVMKLQQWKTKQVPVVLCVTKLQSLVQTSISPHAINQGVSCLRAYLHPTSASTVFSTEYG